MNSLSAFKPLTSSMGNMLEPIENREFRGVGYFHYLDGKFSKYNHQILIVFAVFVGFHL